MKDQTFNADEFVADAIKVEEPEHILTDAEKACAWYEQQLLQNQF